MLRVGRLLVLILVGFLLSACHVIKYPSRWSGAPVIPADGESASAARPTHVPSPDHPRAEPSREPNPQEVDAALEYARSLVGSRGPLLVGDRQFTFDCSGYVCAIYYQVGEELMVVDSSIAGPERQSGTAIIYRRLEAEGKLFSRGGRPGDLVFFDNTWDRDNDGQLNDELTHIGVVEEISSSGTLIILHLGNSGIGRIHMNLEYPDLYRDEKSGEILNHKLRRQTRRDPAETVYLTGQLFRAFGRPE